MNIIDNLLPTLQHIGVGGYWLVLLFALVESLAFVGSIVPGALVIVLAGFLSSQGYLDIGDLIWFAAIGAILGDCISYYLGTKGTRFFKHENRFLKASHIAKGTQFFEKYGSKSIFIGRFVGFLRPIIPFIAGLTKMNIRVFLFWNILSAFAWSIVHLLIGYYFGGSLLAIETWSSRLGVFFVVAIVLFISLWICIKRRRILIGFSTSVMHSIFEALARNPYMRRFVGQHVIFFSFLKKRLNRKKFTGLSLTLLAIAGAYVLFLFIGITEDVLTQDVIVSTDLRIAHLLFLFRNLVLIKIFIWITILGKIEIVMSILITVSIILWLWKKRVYLLHMWIVLAGSSLCMILGKMLINRDRPGALIPFYIESSTSFPSGHATIAVALYGFLTYIASKQVAKIKYQSLIIFSGLSVIILVGFSRMYLGVHYISDVFGGYLIGLLWLIIGITLVEWHLHKRQEQHRTVAVGVSVKYITASLILFEIIMYVFFGYHYTPTPNTYSLPNSSPIVISPIDIFSGPTPYPKFTEGVFGAQQEPLSLIIIAKDDISLVSAFEHSGWLKANPINATSLIDISKAILFKTSYTRAPMTPSFWNTNIHNIGFEKPTPKNLVSERHHIRVWKTNSVLVDNRHIYVGTASFDKNIKWGGITHAIAPDIDTERDLVLSDFQNANTLEYHKVTQFVTPGLGKNLSGDQFFTDGKIYILYTH